MKVYGEVDRDKEGNIKSDYPAWYLERHVEELEESVKKTKYQLENDLVHPEEKGMVKERLRQEEGRLEKIIESKPELDDTEKDGLSKSIDDIGKKISASMFTRSDMTRGLADAHEEARRMSSPVIIVKSEKEAELYKACGIKISDSGKVNRIEAEKVWKIGRKILGENTNTESLRKGQ